MSSNLIDRLNELVGLTPDQVVAGITDPIATPVSIATLGRKGLNAIEGRWVHFLEYSDYAHKVVNDSGAAGEVFHTDGVYIGWASGESEAGQKWHIVSHEAFVLLDLGTLKLPPRD